MAGPPQPTAPGAASARWLDTPLIRQAGRDMLSLALMDARNHTLQLFGQLERGLAGRPLDPEAAQLAQAAGLSPPDWLLGEVGWFQERWVGRNLQRQLGERADPTAAPLASLWPEADRWWDGVPLAERWCLQLPAAEALREFLLLTLEGTLELLAQAPETDDGLHVFRLALLHEDLQSEALVVLAQTLGLPLQRAFVEAFAVPALPMREPLWLPACQFTQGSAPGGFAFAQERPAHPVAVPAFEIDAQPVNWAQFVEFVDDGGYDRRELWSEPGWAWLQAQALDGRRAPRHVAHLGAASGAVVQQRFGQPLRMAAQQPVTHVSLWEAQAWCRWASRRLPLEVEWELAAETASRRGFRWGDVWEWTASRLQPYPGFVPGLDAAGAQAAFGRAQAVRGGSRATRARLKSSRLRRFAEPGDDALGCGFRSCAL